MIEPLKSVMIADDYNRNTLTRLTDTINEVIAEVNRQERRWEKLDESMEKEQSCEHGDEIPAFCKLCQEKAYIEEGTLLPPDKFRKQLKADMIASYQSELKAKIEAIKQGYGNDSHRNSQLVLDDALKLIEGE